MRVHCATCVCADEWRRDRVDVSAPFYGLVLAVDRILLAEQRERYLRTRAEHEGEPSP